MLKANQHSFLIRFQNSNNNYIMFNDSTKSLEELAVYLFRNRTLIIKDIKIYDPVKTRYVRANKNNMLKSMFWTTTILDQELIRRNFY